MVSETDLRTTSEVIDACGGTGRVSALTGRSVSAVSNWRGWNHFPSNTYLAFQDRLRVLGKSASPSLWRMQRPESERVQSQPEVAA